MNRHSIIFDGSAPIKLSPARSWRTYLGGKLIDEIHGKEDSEDSHFPEEWIISIVSSRTEGREADGLNKLDLPGIDITLKEMVDEHPIDFLGKQHVEKLGKQTGVLVKLIDSAERLIIQAHPDKEKARQLFNFAYGKTECWHFIGGREINGEPPYVYLGFKPGVTKEQWKKLFNEQDIEGMLDCMHKYYVRPGDTFLIEAGIPHAIGAGCLLVEIQEPTDYTIRLEKSSPSGLKLEDYLLHQGLGFEKMFDIFRYEAYTSEETLEKWKVAPAELLQTGGFKETELIGYQQTPCFRMTLIEVEKEVSIEGDGVFSGLYILSGNAVIKAGEMEQYVKKGDQLFIPAKAVTLSVETTGKSSLKALRLFGPALV
ncbi:type I phosphomannose isomerase catalytic subunit [Bacillus infantis]|uniref:type I phosphomannose isomerase catalytic subunit n=1 Tax=Bacillus infantis TaxID=324767 RepID=UPI00209D7A95|nr:type I phosphomannose isomerase catalytic subunit [Bacillus infantis]MCP1159117.1 class I mannose-6-phosphate isomerase [Bacillus infantis]